MIISKSGSLVRAIFDCTRNIQMTDMSGIKVSLTLKLLIFIRITMKIIYLFYVFACFSENKSISKCCDVLLA